MIQILEIVGWIGVIVYVAAYGLLSLGWLKADRSLYHVLNGIGGLALVIHSNAAHDMPNVIVNAVWLGIAALSILKIISYRKKRTTE
jgi:hypothetical protein